MSRRKSRRFTRQKQKADKYGINLVVCMQLSNIENIWEDERYGKTNGFYGI